MIAGGRVEDEMQSMTEGFDLGSRSGSSGTVAGAVAHFGHDQPDKSAVPTASTGICTAEEVAA